MRWTVLLRCDGDALTDTEVQLLTLQPDDLPDFAQLGLIHREGKRLLLTLQRALLVQQSKQYFARRRQCNRCSVPRNDQRQPLTHPAERLWFGTPMAAALQSLPMRTGFIAVRLARLRVSAQSFYA